MTGDPPTLPGRLPWDSFPDPEDRARLQPFRTALSTEFPGTAPDQPPAAGQPGNQKGKPTRLGPAALGCEVGSFECHDFVVPYMPFPRNPLKYSYFDESQPENEMLSLFHNYHSVDT